DRDAGARLCGLSAPPDPAPQRRVVPGARTVALPPVARGSRYQLVDYAGGAREAPARHAWRLPLGPPPDVPGPVPLLRGPGAGSSQLVGGPVLRRCHAPPLRLPSRARGAHDAGGIREGLRGVQRDDEAPGPRRLVTNERVAAGPGAATNGGR